MIVYPTGTMSKLSHVYEAPKLQIFGACKEASDPQRAPAIWVITLWRSSLVVLVNACLLSWPVYSYLHLVAIIATILIAIVLLEFKLKPVRSRRTNRQTEFPMTVSR